MQNIITHLQFFTGYDATEVLYIDKKQVNRKRRVLLVLMRGWVMEGLYLLRRCTSEVV